MTKKAKELGNENTSGIFLVLTLREHFAGLAMQGLCADHRNEDIPALASDAVRIADALLDKLSKDE